MDDTRVTQPHRAARRRGAPPAGGALRGRRPRARGARAAGARPVELDKYWDLLRQRRARERAGLDPDDASLRDADTVERYLQ